MAKRTPINDDDEPRVDWIELDTSVDDGFEASVDGEMVDEMLDEFDDSPLDDDDPSLF